MVAAESSSVICPFDELPSEILSLVFFLIPDTKTLGRLLRVCKRFFECLKTEQKIWRNHCLQLWQEKGFSQKVSLENVVKELRQYDSSKDWIWISACFAQEDIESALSWKKFNTISGRSLVSIGCMNKHKLNDVGVEVYLDGSTFYLGHFVEGKLHGKGCIFWEGGAKYEGDWHDGHREGWGSYTWSNGDRYVGEFKNDGKKEGTGTFYYADGDRFEGNYKNDEREGWGKMIWSGSKFIFEGNFVNNEPEDPEASLHPSLRESIKSQLCTGVVTGKSFDFVCWNSCPHTKHSNGEAFKWVRRWSDGTYCACIENNNCAKRPSPHGEGPPAKRHKASE
jgi:hypothetical protein